MITEKDYCDYETCIALEEVGFPLHPYGNTEIDTSLRLTVLLYSAQKWLREEKNLHIEVRLYCNMWYEYEVKEAEGNVIAEGSAFKIYEEALSTAVYMATEYLKEK